MKKMDICRPKKLTCRWVNEITSAIGKVCPELERVQCSKDDSPEEIWVEYMSRLGNSSCKRKKIVKRIMTFEIDYNDILKKI